VRRRGFELHQHLRKICVRRRAAYERDMWSALENLFPFLLGHAAEDSELLALGLQLLVIGEAMKHLLLGLVADRAGVVEDQVGLLDGLDLAIALLDERADDFLGVVDIHLASEGFEVKGLLRVPRHITQV